MTKKLIVDELKRASDLSEAEAGRRVDEVFNAVGTVARSGKSVRVPGFGTFKMTHRKSRTGRNPRTGEPVQIAARDALTFKQASDF